MQKAVFFITRLIYDMPHYGAFGMTNKAFSDQTATFYISFRNDPKFSDRQVLANRADPDQTAPKGAA